MPFYYRIDGTTDEGKRTAQGLLRLRKQLDAQIPPRKLASALLLATWNIRHFGGNRWEEALYYIAEIISRFDIIAVQEVKADLSGLAQVQRILGHTWKYVVTDVTMTRTGNYERLAFLYDENKVRFRGLAGEVVLSDSDLEKVNLSRQLARTPYLCGFQAGWWKFNLCTVHIYYGGKSANQKERVAEIGALAKYMARRAEKQAESEENLVLLGDFNIFKPEDKTMEALTDVGFFVPESLQSIEGSNVAKDKHYDQIAFVKKDLRLGYEDQAGVFDYYESVFRKSDEAVYAPLLNKTPEDEDEDKGFDGRRTYQMSDHLPMWVELRTDFGRQYLESKLA